MVYFSIDNTRKVIATKFFNSSIGCGKLPRNFFGGKFCGNFKKIDTTINCKNVNLAIRSCGAIATKLWAEKFRGNDFGSMGIKGCEGIVKNKI